MDLFTIQINSKYIVITENKLSSNILYRKYRDCNRFNPVDMIVSMGFSTKISDSQINGVYNINISSIKLNKSGYLFTINDFEYIIPHIYLDALLLNYFSKFYPDNSYIVINSIQDYLICIEYLRYVSFYTHIIACLSFLLKVIHPDLSTTIWDISKLLYMRVEEINKYTTANKFNHNNEKIKANEIITSIRHLYDDIVQKTTDSSLALSSIESIFEEIDASIRKFEDQKVFGYFRGVGVTIYPDSPSIFRPNNERKEDERYRKVKTEYYDSLQKLPFLDRLSMVEHYGLPTRMLNVSSSPLVALYMACNKIFTGDEKQTATGEIIFYYDGIYDLNDDLSKKYYSVFDDINYKCETPIFPYKKHYDSGTILVLAALTKIDYENKLRMKKVISAFKSFIENIPDSKEQQCYVQFVNECVHKQAECFDSNRYFSNDESELLKKMYPAIEFKMNSPFCTNEICQILWDKAKMNINVENTGYTSAHEFTNDFNLFVSSYKYLLATIRRDYVSFRDHINIFDLMKCFHVSPGITNDRIRAQAGSFIMCGLDPEYLHSTYLSSRSKGMVRIFVKEKDTLFKQLNSLRINDATMLPDMQHYADSLKTI